MPLKRPEYITFGRPNFSDAEIDAVARVLRSGWIGMGPETIAFEQELAEAVGAPHVVTVNSCTSALFLSLLTHGVGPGDEVICPSLTWCSTANAALYLGAKPVFCDVDPDTLCVTSETVRTAVTSRTKAVLVVHFGGLAVETDSLRAVLPKHVAIIEDAAHAFGARFADGRSVGSSGNVTCFSFYANKNLSTGEGGAVALFDSEQADRIRSLRQHALPIDAWKRFTHANTILLSGQLKELGYKANYTDLQAAIGRVQLRRQPELQQRRRQIASCYLERLDRLANCLTPQAGLDSPNHAQHLFVVRVNPSTSMGRDELLLELRKQNVGATIHYALLHLMPLYCQGTAKKLSATETVGPELVTLPINASMSPADADYVCEQLESLFTE